MVALLAIITATTASAAVPVFATVGMGNCKNEENCIPQKDRVGADDPDVTRDGPDDEGEANCWGQVTSDAAQDFGSGFGQHAANPTGDEDNDTPREGVGNQDEDHPSDHADTVGPAFDFDDDVECDND